MTSSWTPVTRSWPISGPEFCVVWLQKMLASGWGSLWGSSSIVPWFVPNAIRDVSGAILEWPWFSGFMRKSSRLANAPSTRISVLLNSFDNFFVTLPSTSSETWVMQSSCDLGTFMFWAELRLASSSQFFLLTAASFFYSSELPFSTRKPKMCPLRLGFFLAERKSILVFNSFQINNVGI